MKTPFHDERTATEPLCRATTSRHSTAMKTGAAVLLAASAMGWSAASSAQTLAATELPLAALEKSFWVCDHAATTRRLDSGTAATCSSLYEALKQRKFGGDFKALLAWWQQHKEAEHLALAKAGDAPLARLTPDAPT